MTHAMDWAKRTGTVSRIELSVFERNQRAVQLYRKFGFEVEGRRRRAIFRDGEYLDDLIMALLLCSSVDRLLGEGARLLFTEKDVDGERKNQNAVSGNAV